MEPETKKSKADYSRPFHTLMQGFWKTCHPDWTPASIDDTSLSSVMCELFEFHPPMSQPRGYIWTRVIWRPETKRTYLNVVIQVLKQQYANLPANEPMPDSVQTFLESAAFWHRQLTMDVQAEAKRNELDPTNPRDANWRDLESIVEILNAHAKRMVNTHAESMISRRIHFIGMIDDFHEKQPHQPTRHQWYADYQRLLLLVLYLEIPVRSDFGCVHLKKPDVCPEQYNYVDLTAAPPVFVLNQDKAAHLTHSKMSGMTYNLSPKAVEVIMYLNQFWPERRFLITRISDVTQSAGKFMCQQLLSTIKTVDGTKDSRLGVCTIRSAIATKACDLNWSEAEMEILAKKMRTSLATMRSYYRKIPSLLGVEGNEDIEAFDLEAPSKAGMVLPMEIPKS